jgi:hypothetical protein
LRHRADNLTQGRFERCNLRMHSRRMADVNDRSRDFLVACVFCTIIGLILYSGFL